MAPGLREIHSRLRGLDLLLRAVFADVTHTWADGDIDHAAENLRHALDGLDRLLRDLERGGMPA
jgi:hypothetical protein